jgi:hypothetical protein
VEAECKTSTHYLIAHGATRSLNTQKVQILTNDIAYSEAPSLHVKKLAMKYITSTTLSVIH